MGPPSSSTVPADQGPGQLGERASMGNTPFFHVDAFAERPFVGNPAAVCLLEADRPATWMQSVALDMNLSETAFVHPIEGGYSLRWFTPAVEVALCGHATLATSQVLWQSNRVAKDRPIRFRTASGWLECKFEAGVVWMDFPAKPISATEPPAGLLDALGVAARFVGANDMDFLVEVGSESEVRQVAPNFKALATIPARGTIVTAAADSDGDFVSRFFAPAAGVDEDPVTGSAHCALAPYWAGKLGRSALIGKQLSKRGGTVHVRSAGDRVHLGGQAIIVAEGTLLC